jgi:hypothetical protein
MNNLRDIISSFSRKLHRTYYVVDLVDDFTYTYGTYKECIDVVHWLEEASSAGAPYGIYKRSQLTENMKSSVYPYQGRLTKFIVDNK